MRRRDKSVKAQRRKIADAPKARHRGSSVAAGKETNVALLTRELHEALEQQTATSDVLRIIAKSPQSVQPVFDSIVANAAHLCDATFSAVATFDGELLHLVALNKMSPEEMAAYNTLLPRRPNRTFIMGRAFLDGKPVHVEDIEADPDYDPHTFSVLKAAAPRRTYLGVPILHAGKSIGVIGCGRREVRPFTEAQIALVKTFADQAVIAIENARLFETEQHRTRELSESLEQQTAISEVLRVISSSPGELNPVFKTILENATHLCDANFGTLTLYEGGTFRIVALHGAPIGFSDERQRQPVIRPEQGHHLLRLLETKKLIHIADISADPALAPTLAKFANARTLLTIPMLKENDLVGAIAIYRQEVRPFTDRQIELVKNFGAQAVIAIENARLLDELNKLNQQLEQRVADQVGEIERMGKLRRFLPPQVADLIVASGTEKQLESHRREITALFCDLRGFTGFSESADPEDVMALLHEYHAAIGAIINKYGGTLERYAGDGVMVVFNDPIPVDNPALQAVLMAIDMRAAIGDLIEKWRKLGHDIGFGIGIAHGYATLGTVGFEGRFDYAAIGTVSNVASRLCDEAKPGQILISPRVLMAVENDIMVEPVGDFALKGIRRPLAAYNVLFAKASN
jgi:class 3 adenylate cyclase